MNTLFGGIDRVTVDAIMSRPYGTTSARAYFVDGTNGSDSNEGTQERPFASIGAAITASTANIGDVIIVAPGTYTITSALAPKAGTSIMAGVMLNPRKPTVIVTGAIDLVEIDVSNVRFEGIEFKASADAVTQLVDIADTAAVSGVVFYRCVFNGNDKASVIGINMADASFAASEIVVIECLFRDLTGTGIVVGALGFAYSYIARNQFALDANSATGISLADTTAFATGKGYVIEDNVFTGFDATADEVGITIAGTENTTGAGIIRNNHFAFIAAAAITADKVSQSMVNNYVGDAGTGGTIVDAGTA